MQATADDYKSVNKHANNEKKDLYEYYKGNILLIYKGRHVKINLDSYWSNI